jgi:3-hydroxyisobutyrate dehydrogenase
VKAKPSVLFIGLGNMGVPMATRLADAGFSLAVADLRTEPLAPFAQRGVPTGTHPAELPGAVVVTMLPTDAHVRDALLGAGGALEIPREAVIDMSSSAPRGTLEIAARLAKRKIAFLDVPVSGGVPRAKTGELTAMAGGDAATIEGYRPLLETMCANVRRVGDVGAGVTMKALNNFLSASAMWAACEALVTGAKAGLDPATMVEVWSTSTARSHAVDVKIPKAVLPRTFDYGFALGLMAKDLGIAAEIARQNDVAAPMIAQVQATFSLAADALGSQADLTTILTLIERWSAYSVPATLSKEDS